MRKRQHSIGGRAPRLGGALVTVMVMVAALPALAGTPDQVVKFDAAGNPTANSSIFNSGSNVAIGGTAASHRLRLIGGPTWTSHSWGGALELDSGAAIGWRSGADGRNYGLGATTTGFYVFSTSAAPGAVGAPALFSLRISPEGRVGMPVVRGTHRLSVDGTATISSALGIGTETPSNRLSVAGDADVSGELGIGTTNPTAPLDVRGTVRARGSLILDTSAGLSTVEVRGGFFGSDAWMALRDGGAGTAAERITFAARNGDTGAGGLVHVKNGAGVVTVSIAGDLGDGTGKITTPVLEVTGGSDLAEPFDVADPDVEAGMLVAIDADRPGQLRLAGQPYDTAIAGVVSGANGIRAGVTLKQAGTAADGTRPVALAGRVYCWADAAHGPIRPGDLLTSSSTPGHAMRAADPSRTPGAVLGKAMTALPSGRGLVLVLVSLQ